MGSAGASPYRDWLGITLQKSPIDEWTGFFADRCPSFGHWTFPITFRTCSSAKRTTGIGVWTSPVGNWTRNFDEWTSSIGHWTCRVGNWTERCVSFLESSGRFCMSGTRCCSSTQRSGTSNARFGVYSQPSATAGPGFCASTRPSRRSGARWPGLGRRQSHVRRRRPALVTQLHASLQPT